MPALYLEKCFCLQGNFVIYKVWSLTFILKNNFTEIFTVGEFSPYIMNLISNANMF